MKPNNLTPETAPLWERAYADSAQYQRSKAAVEKLEEERLSRDRGTAINASRMLPLAKSAAAIDHDRLCQSVKLWMKVALAQQGEAVNA